MLVCECSEGPAMDAIITHVTINGQDYAIRDGLMFPVERWKSM